MNPQSVAASRPGGESECAIMLTRRVEIAGSPRYAFVPVDHFMIDAHRKIPSVIAFARPP